MIELGGFPNLAFPLGMIYHKEKNIINISRTKFGNFLISSNLLFCCIFNNNIKIDILYSFVYIIFIALMVIVLISYVKMCLKSFPFIFLGKISYETYLAYMVLY